MKRRVTCALGLLALATAGCEDGTGPLDSPCGPEPEWTCMARSAGPCSPFEVVEA